MKDSPINSKSQSTTDEQKKIEKKSVFSAALIICSMLWLANMFLLGIPGILWLNMVYKSFYYLGIELPMQETGSGWNLVIFWGFFSPLSILLSSWIMDKKRESTNTTSHNRPWFETIVLALAIHFFVVVLCSYLGLI